MNLCRLPEFVATFVSYYETTQHHNPEDLNACYHDDVKSCNLPLPGLCAGAPKLQGVGTYSSHYSGGVQIFQKCMNHLTSLVATMVT